MTPRDAQNRRTTNTRQRKKQQHLLDVKLRASTERRRRTSAIVGIVFKLIAVTVLCTGAWLGGKEALRRFVWENPDYFVREVKITTDGTLTREQILRAGEIVEGTSIFLLNISKARAGISKLAQVETAEVTRTLPNNLSVRITERRPIAWVVSRPDEDPTASPDAFMIDARGVVMKPKVKLEEYLHFPVISGYPTDNLVAGERLTLLEIQAALEVIGLTSDSTRFQARHVDVSKRYCMVVTDHSHAKITFGLEGISAQLARLHQYLARAAADHQEIRTVNLLVHRNTPVTFVNWDAAAEEPAAATKAADKPKSTLPSTRPIASAPSPRVASTQLPLALATPVPVLPKNNLLTPFKSRSVTPAPGIRKGETVKKQPFRVN
ncbi:MAG: ftsQ [Chthoniobacter sp.]|nr:ftsQ [Chthoniobacter sp.]